MFTREHITLNLTFKDFLFKIMKKDQIAHLFIEDFHGACQFRPDSSCILSLVYKILHISNITFTTDLSFHCHNETIDWLTLFSLTGHCYIARLPKKIWKDCNFHTNSNHYYKNKSGYWRIEHRFLPRITEYTNVTSLVMQRDHSFSTRTKFSSNKK